MPTINETIAAGADDGSYRHTSGSGGFTNGYTRSTLVISKYNGVGFSSSLLVALRFQTIAIPAAATIDSATLTFIKRGASITNTINAKIYGNDVDDAAAWGAGNRVKDIAKTTAATVLDVASATSANDVKTVVQEIVNRGGWTTGNDMAFGIFPYNNVAAGYATWQCYAQERGVGFIPALDVTYTEGGGSTAVPVFFKHLQTQGMA